MKTTRALFLACFLPILACLAVAPGCSTAPSYQSAEAKTLAALGATAKAGMDASTQLLKGGHITVAEWQKVAAFYDTRWQPAFTLAVNVARSDLSSFASPDLAKLASEFALLVQSYATRTP